MNKIIKNTPLEYNYRLSNLLGCNIFLKREDLQIVRSFKIRGAYNKIIKNNNQYSKDFVTASAGNHAQGVAYVCNKMDLKCTIFIPENTPHQKISRIKYFSNNDCNLVIKGNDFNESLTLSQKYCNDDTKIFIHPYDDMDVIEGQGTMVTEILEQIKPNIIMAGIGGGGLISGLVTKMNGIECDIIGVEPEGAASMYEAIKNDKIITLEHIDNFVDGASVRRVGDITFEISKNIKNIFKISNGELCSEIINLYQNEGIIAEPAGALSICGLFHLDNEYIKNKNIVCIISGGNNDLMRYPEIIDNSLRHKKKTLFYTYI